ncbi:hypothetical protein LXL04_019793 [Taraxacum kok-saghyz]
MIKLFLLTQDLKSSRKITHLYTITHLPQFWWNMLLQRGFEVLELIVDVENCLQAFVGVADDLNAIIIAFRGTQETSVQNWIEDLIWKQLDSEYPGITDGKVHHGFFNAYNNTIVRSGILDGVSRAKKVYGDIKIMVTGHSMGGAMAAFCGLDLSLIYGKENVSVMTFGQPRIGNAAFASYYSEIAPNTFRITHEHDLVPHLPPYYQHLPHKTYHHFLREVIFNMRSFMTEENNVVSNSFLLDDDSSIPFSVDDISRSMDQIEISDIEPPPLIRENSGFRFLLFGICEGRLTLLIIEVEFDISITIVSCLLNLGYQAVAYIEASAYIYQDGNVIIFMTILSLDQTISL